MTIRGSFKALAWAAALAAGAHMAPAAGAEALRVCADPDNLPFSKAEGDERGLYIEIVELVAKKLGMPIEYTWWYTHNQRRMLRNTINDNACDLIVALPADYRARNLVKTQAFLQVGYAVVAAPGFAFKNLEELKRLRLGVQFSTTPHIVLATMEGFRTTTYRTSDEVFDALGKGEVDAAFLWGPAAGYENNKRHGARWRVTPVAGHDFAGEVAMAVRKDKEALLAPINAALTELAPQIDALARKYGVPQDKPIELSSLARAVAVPAAGVVRVADAATGSEAAAQAGRVRFNDQCSHCHGADGYSPVRERDLRRLKSRYDAKWEETALVTIKNGRSDAGMPAWKDILKEPDIAEVLAFLQTIQR